MTHNQPQSSNTPLLSSFPENSRDRANMSSKYRVTYKDTDGIYQPPVDDGQCPICDIWNSGFCGANHLRLNTHSKHGFAMYTFSASGCSSCCTYVPLQFLSVPSCVCVA